MTHNESGQNERHGTSDSDRPFIQFGVRDIAVVMLFTALGLGAYRCGRQWLPLIIVAFWYYVSRSIRWPGRPISESNQSRLDGRPGTVNVLTRIVAILSGIMNGALIGAIFLIIAAIVTAESLRLVPPVAIGAGVGLVLAVIFPRFFSRFWLPWPF